MEKNRESWIPLFLAPALHTSSMHVCPPSQSILSSTFPAKCPPEGTHIPQKTRLKEERKDQSIFLASKAESLNAKQGVTEMCGNKDLYDRFHVNYPIPTCKIVHNWGKFPFLVILDLSTFMCRYIQAHT